MPQLTIRGINKDIVAAVIQTLLPELAIEMATTDDNFTVDVLTVESFNGQGVCATFPFIQVGWFDRGQMVQDKVAKLIDTSFTQAGVPAIEVVFVTFKTTDYYAEGEHF